MSTAGMYTTVLATELCAAVDFDEKDEGIDISAGLFGTATSDWLRKVAAQLAEKDAEIARFKEKGM